PAEGSRGVATLPKKERVMATTHTETDTPLAPLSSTEEISNLYQEGIVAGVIGAAVIALWFLLIDTVNGRPLYTPTVLGTALFSGGAGLNAPENLAINLEAVLMFTWVHGLVFIVIGGIASRLLGIAEHNPNVGFGILLLFVVFEFGFVAVNLAFADAVLQALSWQAVFLGELLAASSFALCFLLWRP